MKIGYKIIVIALAIICIASLIFTPFMRFAVETILAPVGGFLGQFTGNEEITESIQNNGGDLQKYYKEEWEFYDFVNPSSETTIPLIKTLIEQGDGEMNAVMQSLVCVAVTLVVCAACIVICAIAVIVTSFCKNNRKVIYSAVAGLGSTLMFAQTFKAISAPLLSGELSLKSINNLLGALCQEIVIIEIAPTFWITAVIFALVIVFTVAYNFTLPEKEKVKRKIMLGEAEE